MQYLAIGHVQREIAVTLSVKRRSRFGEIGGHVGAKYAVFQPDAHRQHRFGYTKSAAEHWFALADLSLVHYHSSYLGCFLFSPKAMPRLAIKAISGFADDTLRNSGSGHRQ